MRYVVGAIAMAVLLSVAAAAWADVIELVNGDKIEGKIIEETDAGVKIETKYGAITLSRRQIRRIIKETEAHKEYKEKAKAVAGDHVKLAKWCEEQGMEEEAKKHYKMALEFDPDNEDAKKGLEGTATKPEDKKEEKETGEKKEPEGQITQEELLRLHQEAIAKLQNKEYDEAEKLYLRIVKAVPKDNIALYNLACLYSLTKKIEKSLEYLEKSIKAGFTNAGHMEQDTDLDNIRDTDKYKELIKELSKKSKGTMFDFETDHDAA